MENNDFIRFLNGLSNRIAIELVDYSSTSFSEDRQRLEFNLAKILESVEESGRGGLSPRRALDGIIDCFSMGLSGPPLARCGAGNQIWP